MPYSSYDKYAKNYFDSRSFGNISVFSSSFPFPHGNEDAQHMVEGLPYLVDDVFMLRSHSEQLETAADARIPLQPESTELAIRRMDPDKRRIVRPRHLILKAAADLAILDTAQAQVDFDGGELSTFSVVSHGRKDYKPVDVEIRGVVNDPVYEDTYEIAVQNEDTAPDTMLVAEDTAKDFVHALVELREGSEVTVPSLEAGLRMMIDYSPDYTRLQMGNFEVSRTETESVHVEVERLSRIKKGLVDTSLLRIQLLEESAWDGMAISSTFALIGRQKKKSMSYTAEYNMLINSSDPNQTHADRESIYQVRSCFLREHPEILFEAIKHALETAAVIEI